MHWDTNLSPYELRENKHNEDTSTVTTVYWHAAHRDKEKPPQNTQFEVPVSWTGLQA